MVISFVDTQLCKYLCRLSCIVKTLVVCIVHHAVVSQRLEHRRPVAVAVCGSRFVH